MLEKSCKTCGCPLFEVKGKTLCVVCAENKPAEDSKAAKGGKKAVAATAPAAQVTAPANIHTDGSTCTCGEEHDEESCTCNDGGLAEELAFTIHSLCERIQNENDPENVLALMHAVKVGTEALEILCRL